MSDSPQKRSARYTFTKEEPWNSSWRESTQTRLDCWGDGRATRCSSTSTPRTKVLHRSSWRAWSYTGTMCSSHPPTGDITPFTQVWASLRPPLGSSWVPGTGLARIRKIKHALSNNQTPVTVACSNNYHGPHAGKVAGPVASNHSNLQKHHYLPWV